MKFIKTYKLFEDLNSELISKLKKFKIENYTINTDGFIDVVGNVTMINKTISKIPFKLGEITGNFDCRSNKLTDLEGCPYKIGGSFYCSDNQLTNLKFCPSKIDGEFKCERNKINSLEGSPLEIESKFSCYSNQLTSLQYCPSEIGSDLDCQFNNLTMLDCSSYVKGNIYCQGNKFTEEPEFFGDCEGKIYWKRVKSKYRLGL